MKRRSFLIAGGTSLCLLSRSVRADDKPNPLAKDKTGLRWVLPFKAAQQQAAAENRLLFIKPVAFGTSPDGGW